MIPDDVDSKPIYRRLAQRTPEEQEQLAQIKAKLQKVKKEIKRKSQSLNPKQL